MYNTILVGKQIDQTIDVDIDILDAACRKPGTSCVPLHFTDGEESEYDLRADVLSSCSVSPNILSYSWKITHQASGTQLSYTGFYIENFDFSLPGEWSIELSVTDGCGNSASEKDTLIIQTNQSDEDWIFDVDIVIHDDNCSPQSIGCPKLAFENQEDDGDDTFDFTLESIASPGELESCSWKISHSKTGQYFQFSECYIDDFTFPSSGVWEVSLTARDTL